MLVMFSASSVMVGLSVGLRRGALACALWAGCSADDAGRDAGQATHALVRAELTYTRSGSSLAFDARAHFARFHGLEDAHVSAILGWPDWTGVPMGGCAAAGGTALLDEALARARTGGADVALLDAGRLEVRGPTGAVVVPPLHYPDVVPFVAGAIYGTAGEALALVLGERYLVTSDGGTEVGPWRASVAAPAEHPELTASNPFDLVLSWRAPAEPAGPLAIEIKAGARGLRCRVRDDGALTIPHAALPLDAGPLTITATRAARAPLVAPGAGRGELVLSLRDVVVLP